MQARPLCGDIAGQASGRRNERATSDLPCLLCRSGACPSAMLLGHVHTRLLLPGLAQLTDPGPPAPSTLRTYQRALDQLTQEAGLAA